MLYGKYPKFAGAWLNRHIAYNRTIKKILKLEEQGKIFVLRRDEPLNIGRMEKVA